MGKRKSTKTSSTNGRPRFGAHMSIAGGLHLAFERAAEVGCECLQLFVKNQRQWQAPSITDEQIKSFKAAREPANIEPIVAHATYLINLAAPDETNRTKSIDAFADELNRCEQLGLLGLVVHPGAHLGEGEQAGIKRIAQSLDMVHNRTKGIKPLTLLETTAGQGSSIGHTFEQLAAIRSQVKAPERVAVCLDTCHVFAAGYNLSTQVGYDETMAAFDKQLGLDLLHCIHVNDSVKPLGSRVDRHAAIGEGELGRSAFKYLVNDKRLRHIPMILETPKGEDDRGRNLDKVNLGKLRRMIAR
jgi:deoxyribonuclease-4